MVRGIYLIGIGDNKIVHGVILRGYNIMED